jgi:hypothetical protein
MIEPEFFFAKEECNYSGIEDEYSQYDFSYTTLELYQHSNWDYITLSIRWSEDLPIEFYMSPELCLEVGKNLDQALQDAEDYKYIGQQKYIYCPEGCDVEKPVITANITIETNPSVSDRVTIHVEEFSDKFAVIREGYTNEKVYDGKIELIKSNAQEFAKKLQQHYWFAKGW